MDENPSDRSIYRSTQPSGQDRRNRYRPGIDFVIGGDISPVLRAFPGNEPSGILSFSDARLDATFRAGSDRPNRLSADMGIMSH